MPNYPTEEDLDAAAGLQCRMMLDGPGLVEAYAERDMLRDGIGLRLNPGGVFRFGNSEVKLDAVKFGFRPEDAIACIEELKRHGIRSVGIHSYLSGNTLEPQYYPAASKKLIQLAMELIGKTGIQISYINISGGLGIPYRPEDQPLDLIAIGEQVRQVFTELTSGTPLERVPIYTEAGRWITGPAGLLVTRVTHIRNGIQNIAGVDASASNLMRPMMYGSYHHISVAGQEGATEREKWDVVGTVCENTDKFAAGRPLPPLHVGDTLAIHDAGAHGYSMGYQYGGRLRCAEYLLRENGDLKLIRRAETAADYFATMVF